MLLGDISKLGEMLNTKKDPVKGLGIVFGILVYAGETPQKNIHKEMQIQNPIRIVSNSSSFMVLFFILVHNRIDDEFDKVFYLFIHYLFLLLL